MQTLTEWFNNLDPTLRIFWGVAVFATVIFVIQMSMSFIGMGGDSDGGDIDLGSADADAGGTDSMDDAGAMSIISIRNVIYFLFGFGWAGVSFFHLIHSHLLLLVASALTGCAFVAIYLFIFRQMMKLQHNGAFDINDALGKVCDVYLRIPATGNGMGKVQISFNGSVQELDARTEGDAQIPSGAKVKVTGIVGRVLVVEAL